MHGSIRPPNAPKSFRSARPVAAILLGFLMVASAAVAGVVLSYSTPSTAALALKAPPIQWSAGPDSSGNNFVASWSLSPNATYYTVTLKPVPEANVTWGNVTTLSNTDSSSYSAVTVSATSLAAYAKVVTFRLEFYDYAAPSTVAGALNLTAASPSHTFTNMAAGKQYFMKAYIQLDSGTGQQDLPSSVTISLAVTP